MKKLFLLFTLLCISSTVLSMEVPLSLKYHISCYSPSLEADINDYHLYYSTIRITYSDGTEQIIVNRQCDIKELKH